jgi:hypothetical protein
MSTRTFDFALAARRHATLSAALVELGPFIELCKHAAERRAFPPEALAWSASREPLALSVLVKGEPIWSVMVVETPAPWLVSVDGEASRMTKAEALQNLARTLAAAATLSDGVRFEWRKDGTIGGTF